MVIRSETGDIIRARWLPEESDFGKKETICRGQMLLNVGKPTAGKGGPAAPTVWCTACISVRKSAP